MLKLKKIMFIALAPAIVLFLFVQGVTAGQYAAMGKGVLHVLGIGLTADPEQQTAPLNTATAVNTNLMLPDISFDGDIPEMPQGLMVAAELSGPGISTPMTIKAIPGEQLMIPPLPQKGTYMLSNIRLVSGDKVVLYAEPSMALIDTIEKIIVTQVTSRALSIDEIEDLGITINPENFTAYSFTVGFGTETGPVEMEIPVVMDVRDEGDEDFYGGGVGPPSFAPPGLKVPNLEVKPVKLEQYDEEVPRFFEMDLPISGAIIIPGNIAFLNQFFEVLLLVTNNAPDGTPLVVTDIS